MKQFLSIIILATLLVSCGSKSGNRKPLAQLVAADRNVPFRAHYTWISEVTLDRYKLDEVEIIEADSAFRAGDTIKVSGKQYILQERVQ
jgi:hypothetical protein